MVFLLIDLTGTEDGKKLLNESPDILNSLIQLTWDDAEVIAKDAALTLINISAEEAGSRALLDQHNQVRLRVEDSFTILHILLNSGFVFTFRYLELFK